jgi:cytidyltransferase-like protein
MSLGSDSGAPRYGVVLGRFQPLHNGHLEYLEAARKKADKLIVGITNPDKDRLIHDSADPHRSAGDSNPFPYFDRQLMIEASLTEAGWAAADFAVVPAPVNSPAEMLPYLPPPAVSTVCITVYDAWGDRKAEVMRDLGYRVEILWRRERNSKITSGTAIRSAMRTGGNWRDFVPGAVARHLDDSGWTETMAGGRQLTDWLLTSALPDCSVSVSELMGVGAAARLLPPAPGAYHYQET